MLLDLWANVNHVPAQRPTDHPQRRQRPLVVRPSVFRRSDTVRLEFGIETTGFARLLSTAKFELVASEVPSMRSASVIGLGVGADNRSAELRFGSGEVVGSTANRVFLELRAAGNDLEEDELFLVLT